MIPAPDTAPASGSGLQGTQGWLKFFVLFILYAAPYIPMTFFPLAFPVLLRQSGASLEQIGLLGVFAIPFVLKFLWAPYVDKYGSATFGHYKSWLIASQLVCTVIGCAMGFLRMPDQFWLIIALGLCFVTSVSTQLIALNGLSVLCLSEEERARGNSIAMLGSTIGNIAGSGLVMLVGPAGFPASMALSTVLLVGASVILLFYREPAHPPVERKVSILSSFEPMKSASMRRWLMLINLCIIGDVMIMAMVRPMLVDKQLSLDSIGLMIGPVRMIFAIAGALLSAPVIKRFERRTNLVVFGLFNTVFLSLFIPSALDMTGPGFLYVVFALAGLGNGFKWNLIYSIFMDHSRKQYAATDFAVQVSVLALGSSLYELASGKIAALFGYAPLFGLSIVLDFLGILFIGLFYRNAERPVESEQWNSAAVGAEAAG